MQHKYQIGDRVLHKIYGQGEIITCQVRRVRGQYGARLRKDTYIAKFGMFGEKTVDEVDLTKIEYKRKRTWTLPSTTN